MERALLLRIGAKKVRDSVSCLDRRQSGGRFGLVELKKLKKTQPSLLNETRDFVRKNGKKTGTEIAGGRNASGPSALRRNVKLQNEPRWEHA